MTRPANTSPPPQSVALVWTVLVHVLALPLAGAFLPALVIRPAAAGGSGPGAAYLLAGVFLVLIVGLHFALWRQARGKGERRLAVAILVLGALSLASLALLATPSPLVGLVHLGALLV